MSGKCTIYTAIHTAKCKGQIPPQYIPQNAKSKYHRNTYRKSKERIPPQYIPQNTKSEYLCRRLRIGRSKCSASSRPGWCVCSRWTRRSCTQLTHSLSCSSTPAGKPAPSTYPRAGPRRSPALPLACSSCILNARQWH